MCNDCPICMEPLFPKTSNIMRLKKKVAVKRGEKLPITKLKCGHMYHNKCIKDWFKKTEVESSTKCPMCRDTIRFKPDSKDLMMHRIRYNDPTYEYGDEYLYEVETISDEDNWSSDDDNQQRVFPLFGDEEVESDYDDSNEGSDYDDSEFIDDSTETTYIRIHNEWYEALTMMEREIDNLVN